MPLVLCLLHYLYAKEQRQHLTVCLSSVSPYLFTNCIPLDLTKNPKLLAISCQTRSNVKNLIMNTPTKSLLTMPKSTYKTPLRIENAKTILGLAGENLNPAYRTFCSNIKARLLSLGITSKSESSEAWNRVVEWASKYYMFNDTQEELFQHDGDQESYDQTCFNFKILFLLCLDACKKKRESTAAVDHALGKTYPGSFPVSRSNKKRALSGK